MPLLEWDDSFGIGHAEIDEDHRVMLALINELHDVQSEGSERTALGAVFDRLIEHSRQHFEREETIMAALHYDHDRLLEQCSEHRILADQLRGMQSRLDVGDAAAPIAEELQEFLMTWFYGHVLEEDMKFKPYLAGGA